MSRSPELEPASPSTALGRARARLSAPDRALLGLLLVSGALPLVLLAVTGLIGGKTLTGATGIYPADQLQYMAWAREEAGHLLAASNFDLVPSGHVLIDPMFLVSGLGFRVGLPIQVAFLAWFPIAAAVLFGGFRAYVRRTVTEGFDRTFALALALFACTPVLPLLAWTSAVHGQSKFRLIAIAIDSNPSGQLWGYFPIAIVLGLLALILLAVERALSGQAPRKHLVLASMGGALVAWLHPWQGATLIVILLALVALGRPWRPKLVLALPVLATSLPIVYYAILPHVDSAWALAKVQNGLGAETMTQVLMLLAPLGLLALGGAFRPIRTVQDRILLIWPAAALFVYWLSPPYATHAVETISLPLAVLAARGWRSLPARKLVLGCALVVLTLPGIAYLGDILAQQVGDHQGAYLLPRDDARALSYLAATPARGGVLAPTPPSISVPALAGRKTWIGHPSWTPGMIFRDGQARVLFEGRLTAVVARRRVRRIGAPLVFAPCGTSPRLAGQLRPITLSVHRIGCAAVYRVRTGPVPPRVGID
jgi:hypothetical protein